MRIDEKIDIFLNEGGESLERRFPSKSATAEGQILMAVAGEAIKKGIGHNAGGVKIGKNEELYSDYSFWEPHPDAGKSYTLIWMPVSASRWSDTGAQDIIWSIGVRFEGKNWFFKTTSALVTRLKALLKR